MLLPAHRAVLMGGTRALMRRNLAAHFDAGLGITAAGGFASRWSDLSGNARHLLQATGANQPIHLPYSGTKYAQNFGVAGNYFSTGNKPLTGNLTFTIDTELDDYTPASATSILDERGTGVQGVNLLLNTNGSYTFYVGDGASSTGATSNIPGWTDRTRHELKIDWQDGVGATFFFDGVQSGSQVPIAKTLVNGGGVFLQPISGKYYRLTVTNSGATTYFDFDPSRWTSGSTFPASSGETWTIISTGSKHAQIVDRPSLLFDGAAHKMASADFGLVQPYVRILVARTPTHTVGDVLADGLTLNTGALRQTTASPKLSINAGASACETSMTLGAWKVVTAVVNGASSSLRENLGTPITGNVGAGNPGGLMIGADGAGLNYGNLQYTDELIYSAVPSESELQNIIRALMNKWGIA